MDISFYDRFSKVYDWLSPKWYYHKARSYAVQQLNLKPGQTILNLPCGTGQNFEYFQKYLKDSGLIIGIDLSPGMLNKAEIKIKRHEWSNIKVFRADARNICDKWLKSNIDNKIQVDALICDLGLSGFPEWQSIVDNMLELLSPNGTMVIMDWYLPKPSLRGAFIKWIGKGEVDRPIYQYLEKRVNQFRVNTTFNRGGVFVATAVK
ncbi:class I SAM-dependent methyltransferase [Portibacter marinus]|uniref:class I SAM-dependent methyltransferase n=1 Tax=Portibacter marinus TaxID=2898660 RepID=UPI001F2C9FD8|nr:methyltransferase domain-containing protein [Portibacter marinus]